MKKLILKFLRPYVLQILKESLKVTKTRGGMVSDVVAGDPPPDPIPPIIP